MSTLTSISGNLDKNGIRAALNHCKRFADHQTQSQFNVPPLRALSSPSQYIFGLCVLMCVEVGAVRKSPAV